MIDQHTNLDPWQHPPAWLQSQSKLWQDIECSTASHCSQHCHDNRVSMHIHQSQPAGNQTGVPWAKPSISDHLHQPTKESAQHTHGCACLICVDKHSAGIRQTYGMHFDIQHRHGSVVRACISDAEDLEMYASTTSKKTCSYTSKEQRNGS